METPTAKQLNTDVLAYFSPEELLSHLIQNGKIDVDDVKNEILRQEREEILKNHPYAISFGGDGRWRTYVKDPDDESKRRMLAKTVRKDLEDALVDYYRELDETLQKRSITLRDLYPKWLAYKEKHTRAETYITRIESDWKKFYQSDPIVDKPIASLKKLELDEWAHQLIKDHDMTRKMYYNVSLILRQCLVYAVDLEIIESNPFEKVHIDSRRMFRVQRKKADETQVYTKAEVEEIFRLAWNNFYNSNKLKHRLAPLAVMFQFLTGLRVGELCAVKHSDVSKGKIYISRMLRRDNKSVTNHTKTNEDREILLTEAALDLIAIAKEYQVQHGIDTEYIFSVTEEPLRHTEINILLKRYCIKAGIPYRSSHKARKTYISTLIDAGVNINTIRSFAGHSDERTTYQCYCYDRSTEEDKRQLLESALAG